MGKKTVLFLCTGNSCRSQMAEGWARHYWGERYLVYSAGIKKHGMNPRAMQVMQEAGVDISSQTSKTTNELVVVSFDFVVTVCEHAHENCPYYPGTKIVHIGFQDPPALSRELVREEDILAVYRRVRDEIEAALKNLPALLGEE